MLRNHVEFGTKGRGDRLAESGRLEGGAMGRHFVLLATQAASEYVWTVSTTFLGAGRLSSLDHATDLYNQHGPCQQ
jgi:hypothetical protein